MSSTRAGNQQFGLWFAAIFIVPGVIAILIAVLILNLPTFLGGALSAGVGTVMAVTMRRSHKQAVPTIATVAALVASGRHDRTGHVRSRWKHLLPGPVADHLQISRDRDATVAELAGIEPAQPQVAALHRELWDGPVMAAESWLVTSTERTNDQISGGSIEPRVAAWTYLPALVGNVTIRPDNARMKLADLTGIATDHKVDWDAVDTTWHLHGDDEALLRAVIDIGLMGRLSELDGRWIVRFVGQTLMVIPTAPKNRLAAKPPALIDVAAEIGHVVAELRSILPQMLFSDLDQLLAAYRD